MQVSPRAGQLMSTNVIFNLGVYGMYMALLCVRQSGKSPPTRSEVPNTALLASECFRKCLFLPESHPHREIADPNGSNDGPLMCFCVEQV